MSFDEQPDGDIHGECAADIHRLEQWQNEAAALLATFVGLSSRPDELEWSKVAIKVPALLAEEEAYKADAESQLDRAEAKDQLNACRPYLKEGETPAECLARNRLDIDRLMGFLATEKTARENLQADAARYRWLCEHPKLVGHCFGYLDYRPDQIDAAIDRARAAQEVE